MIRRMTTGLVRIMPASVSDVTGEPMARHVQQHMQDAGQFAVAFHVTSYVTNKPDGQAGAVPHRAPGRGRTRSLLDNQTCRRQFPPRTISAAGGALRVFRPAPSQPPRGPPAGASAPISQDGHGRRTHAQLSGFRKTGRRSRRPDPRTEEDRGGRGRGRRHRRDPAAGEALARRAGRPLPQAVALAEDAGRPPRRPAALSRLCRRA